MAATGETWIAGDAYESYMGRWSRPVARAFITWLDAPAQARWVDVGCGTGALTAAVLAAVAPSLVCSLDASAPYVAFARRKVGDARASFAAADARSLPLVDGCADAVVSGLVLNFVPDPDRALAEMARVTRAGGTVAVYVWDYADGMQVLRRFWDVATSLDPGARPLDEGQRFPLCHLPALEARFRAAGLHGVAGRAIDVPASFNDFADYWTPFLGGQGPAPGYVASLGDSQRARLRDRLRAELPVDANGGIHLGARAWAVRGTRGP